MLVWMCQMFYVTFLWNSPAVFFCKTIWTSFWINESIIKQLLQFLFWGLLCLQPERQKNNIWCCSRGPENKKIFHKQNGSFTHGLNTKICYSAKGVFCARISLTFLSICLYIHPSSGCVSQPWWKQGEIGDMNPISHLTLAESTSTLCHMSPIRLHYKHSIIAWGDPYAQKTYHNTKQNALFIEVNMDVTHRQQHTHTSPAS